MTPREAAAGFLDEVFSHAAARIIMLGSAPVLGMIVWLGGNWLDHRFDIIDAKVQNLSVRVEDVNKQVSDKITDATTAIDKNSSNDLITHDRLMVTEQTIIAAKNDRDDFQKRLIDQLTSMQKDISRQSIDVAAISAFLAAQNSRQGSNQPGGGVIGSIPTGPTGPRGMLR